MGVPGIKFNFSIEKARETQSRLSKQIIFEDVLPERIRFVAGVDVAYVKEWSVGAVVVLDYASLKTVESQIAVCRTRFPYIPTLLSFREIPPTFLSVRKLQVQPNVFLVDAHGFAHPYRCGFASHLGVVMKKPTIGVAKSRLFGEVEKVKGERGVALLKHGDEVVGAVVTTKLGCKPVFVSVGNMVSLETAVKIVKHCSHRNRVPEPVLRAHELAAVEKRKIISR